MPRYTHRCAWSLVILGWTNINGFAAGTGEGDSVGDGDGEGVEVGVGLPASADFAELVQAAVRRLNANVRATRPRRPPRCGASVRATGARSTEGARSGEVIARPAFNSRPPRTPRTKQLDKESCTR